jgi:signal transduction histidine kinase
MGPGPSRAIDYCFLLWFAEEQTDGRQRMLMEENKENFRVMADVLSRAIGRLIEAQDQERTLIARELHDDIGASLAILGVDLLRAGKSVSGSPRQNHPDMEQIYDKLQEIGSRISRLSYQLQPPMLKYFGLAKAIEVECKEFSESRKMPVSYSCENFAAKPDAVVGLHVFRVVQEALCNAGKHSHATRVAVNVNSTSTELALAVSDNGVGFNEGQTNIVAGLGLISMRERIRLIGGEFEVWSQPGRGVKISCCAPLIQSVTVQTPHS